MNTVLCMSVHHVVCLLTCFIWTEKRASLLPAACALTPNPSLLCMSSDSKYLAYATELGELEVLSVESGERLAEVRIRCVFLCLSNICGPCWHPAQCPSVTQPAPCDPLTLFIVSSLILTGRNSVTASHGTPSTTSWRTAMKCMSHERGR